MIQTTLESLEARLQHADSLPGPEKAELLTLVGVLRAEVDALSMTHDDAARSIVGFAGVSAHEATRPGRNPTLLRLGIEGLETSVAGFEKSHPRLVEIVNRICTTLSNLGI
jgi:hypothetical protein